MRVDPELLESLGDGHPLDASACLNCGSCTALCPLGVGLFPRRLFRFALLGAREELLSQSEAIFSCLLCKMCEENCPAGVPITENVRVLRNFVAREQFRLGSGGWG